MSTDVKQSWAETRLPFLACLRTGNRTPSLAREAPYLATLPALITAALLFLAASGLVLAVYYNPAHAFDSLQFIDRNVSNGWLIHGFHATGTTMLFGAVYLLLFRGILTRGYRAPGELVWVLGVVLFSLLLLVGYLGYALTGGAVSDWSLIASTNAAGALTGVPGAVGTWFFGGPNGAGTLARLVVFHAVLALAAFGILALYHAGTRALAPKVEPRAAVRFYPYYTAQYFVALVVFALIFAVLVFFAPHFGQNPLNAAPANPLIVPALLTPPWYLAPFGAVQAVFPGIYGGIIGVIALLAVLFALPWLDRSGPNTRPGFLYRFLVFVLALDVIALGLAAASGPSLVAGILVVVFTIWYFLHFLVLTPLITALEAE
jgi:quinol-cytochrome oxidoreductase complex cytochrome b subunit